MDKTTDDKYFIALASIEEIGGVFIKKIIEIKGSVEQAWNINLKDFENSGLRKSTVEEFLRKRDAINPEKMLNLTVEKGINWITYNDKNYPKLLKEIEPSPMTLFYKGNLENVNFDKTLSVVGSRKASTLGKENLSRILKDFYGTDLTIVSGGAMGVDTCAHQNAINNKLSTIVVLGSGLDNLYPVQNISMFNEIIDNYGVIMTEYWHSFEPMPFRFPIRNRIVSGLSKGTLIVEAALKSGAMITANLCLEQNRELMCMPGNINNPNTQGIYKLLKNGATLVTSAQDIMDAMNWQKLQPVCSQKNISGVLSDMEKSILAEVQIDAIDVDSLANRLNYEITDLMTTLTTMEINGLIKQIDGNKYIACE